MKKNREKRGYTKKKDTEKFAEENRGCWKKNVGKEGRVCHEETTESESLHIAVKK